ncbi:MAG: hypothetical protein K6E29_01000 [Cyanobacteria bacterium RUI128]|nr:hypothetical protein [Cyanobacteria bacterium RUI128]
MGMAASQARYLSLVARKTNTEYEGQQINQERVVLANRTADLFNQMLTTEVPTCPDSNDFTTIQYSWSDGYNDSVLSDYYQISNADEDYNYVVTNYHYEDVYTGTRKVMNDPKVVADRTVEYTYSPTSSENNTEFVVRTMRYDIDTDTYIATSENRVRKEFTKVYDAGDTRLELDAIHNRTYKAYAPAFEYDDATKSYKYPTDEYDGEGERIYKTFTLVDKDDDLQLMKLKATYGPDIDNDADYYYNAEEGSYVCGKDIEEMRYHAGKGAEITVRREFDGTVYYTDGEKYVTAEELRNITLEDNILNLKTATRDMTFYNFMSIGNCKLDLLTAEDLLENEDISTELQQIIQDMNSEDKGHKQSAAHLNACFNPDTGEYLGGIYTFNYQGQRYYATLSELNESAQSAFDDLAWELADNKIDFQLERLPYYKAFYINTKVEETSKALLQTDGKGRFTSLRLEDDSTVYTLNTETITDEEAYADAMNQYYYKMEKYDKAIRDINAKTELIQAQDRTLELRLKKLDTEQNALQTEMEAVKKVVSKNVETSFKTFSGG